MYNEMASPILYHADFNDITQGDPHCKIGWDLCTGIGSARLTPASNQRGFRIAGAIWSRRGLRPVTLYLVQATGNPEVQVSRSSRLS